MVKNSYQTTVVKSFKGNNNPFNLIKMLFSNTSEISYLLFLQVNPNAKCCSRFNLTSMINFTVLPLFN